VVLSELPVVEKVKRQLQAPPPVTSGDDIRDATPVVRAHRPDNYGIMYVHRHDEARRIDETAPLAAAASPVRASPVRASPVRAAIIVGPIPCPVSASPSASRAASPCGMLAGLGEFNAMRVARPGSRRG